VFVYAEHNLPVGNSLPTIMGTITKNYIIIILFEKIIMKKLRMSVLSSLETSSSPASPSS
jgi:hypothetical protein